MTDKQPSSNGAMPESPGVILGGHHDRLGPAVHRSNMLTALIPYDESLAEPNSLLISSGSYRFVS